MKTTFNIFFQFALVALFVLSGCKATAQPSGAKTQTVEIKTSAVCGMCKTTIEKALFKVKGVKVANLDVASKVVKITFDPKTTTVEALRTAISQAGYDADTVAADPAAYEKLHACCKKDSH